MIEKFDFKPKEKETVLTLYNKVKEEIGTSLIAGDEDKMR
jgi:hypothetical protein